jgi:hypothetical protein
MRSVVSKRTGESGAKRKGKIKGHKALSFWLLEEGGVGRTYGLK